MGWHVQFNIISTDVLKKAQENPEEYRDLVVRVAGYSALFTALDPIQQQDIISRSEYYL
jgi:formate C-acetyltransferase